MKNCDLYLQVKAIITSYESPIIGSFYKMLDDVTWPINDQELQFF